VSERPIFAYPQRPSLRAGESLVLYVLAGDRPIDVRLARSGAELHPLPAGAATFSGRAGEWAAYQVALPPGARSGAYVARIVARGKSCEPLLDTRDGAALFVLMAAAPARVVVNVPLFTYHAYSVGARDPEADDVSGASLYTGAKRVSLARPGGGIGGRLWDERNFDAYDRASPRQTWAHWDAKAVAWLEREGIAYDVCTDLDLHEDAAILKDRTLLLCFGHHEYWTDTMRARVESFVAGGGNVAFFGANSLWFRTAYDAATDTIGRAGTWPRPEAALTGVSYGRGGGWWGGARPPCGLTVHDAAHWLFAGTGLRDGDTFGAAARLVGYECDGIGPPAVVPPTSFELASAHLAALWGDPGDKGEVSAFGRASLVVSHAGGVVVSAGTVDWPRLLGHDAIVTQITRNVIGRFAP
jgi:hypothetical protein